MSHDQQMIARLMFVNRLLGANGDAFQQLFWTVMCAKYQQEFVAVRPQGRLGDGGNDGYVPAEGHYFQVYAPSEPEKKITEAVEKIADDFNKLKRAWDGSKEIKAYSFAFNDKYRGIFREIALALAALEKANPTVKCRPFSAAALEDVFLSLPSDQIRRVLGMLPDPTNVIGLDYGVLKEVIDYIMTSPSTAAPTRFGDLPELNEKIRLNDLCSAWADVVRKGARQAGHVDNYFAKNSTFAKQSLRDHLVQHYQRVRDGGRLATSIPAGISREDLIFDSFRRALLPEGATVPAETAVDVLIGYYFEACDVFDPLAEKDSPSASA